MKKFDGNTVSVKYDDIKFICEVEDVPGSVYQKFPLYELEDPDDYYTFSDKNVVTYFRYCDVILDFDEYINKDLIELYNAIDLLNEKYDILDSIVGEKNRKILCHNIREIKSIIKEKENGKKYVK